MRDPTGLTYDATNQRLFVADFSSVLVYDVATITDGEKAINVFGQPDWFQDSMSSGPRDVAYDTYNKRLFVADYVNSRVLIYDVTTIMDGEGAINVLGQPDLSSRLPATTQSGMNYPIGLAFDTTNQRLFVVDYGNSRVLVFNL
jgi:DNA-binding beta-propeller fold protein YncE